MEKNGLLQLRALLDSEAFEAGISGLLGIEVDELTEGRAVFSLTTKPAMTNPIGTVHGGIVATLLDSALSCAVHTTLGAGETYTTLDLQVRFVRAVPPDGTRITAEGTVVHRGRRAATAEGRVHDEQGRLVAHATVGCLVLQAA